MPALNVPSLLYNIVCALNEKLPAAARGLFNERFVQRLEDIPHPNQAELAETERMTAEHNAAMDQAAGFAPGSAAESSLSPAAPDGVGHLDAISRWVFLAVLVDPQIGLVQWIDTPKERARTLTVAVLYRRWLADDYPADSEWNDITDVLEKTPPENWTNATAAAQMLAFIGTGSPTAVSSALETAAVEWRGRRLPYPYGSPIAAGSLLGRGFDRGLNLLAKVLGRGPAASAANPIHLMHQATWLLDLMNLRWLPTDPQEETLFNRLRKGALGDWPEYSKTLNKKKVEPDAIARIERTLMRMDAVRRSAVLEKKN